MNQIRQHIPGFVEMDHEPERSDFNTTAELLAIPWIAYWTQQRTFLRWSKSENLLMAEFSASAQEPTGSFYVVGFLLDPDTVDLPLWSESDLQRARREAWNRGERRFSYEGKEYPV